MSNDKMAAALGPNWCCWLGRHTNGADHVQLCEHAGSVTTGEHTKAKLADNPYGGITGAQAAKATEHHQSLLGVSYGSGLVSYQISQLGQHTGSSVPGIPYDYEKAEGTDEYANAYMRTLGPPLRPIRRPWAPTKRELIVAGFIACLLIGAIGWTVRLLG